MGGSLKCSICDGPFDIEAEGGIAGDIGMLPMALCPTCYAGMTDMFEQMCCDVCEHKEKTDG